MSMSMSTHTDTGMAMRVCAPRSVGVFCTCAVLCLGSLFLRRGTLGAELGGPTLWRYVTVLFFLLLWGVYIGASAANAYGAI